MSGLEVIGVVLGTIPLIISAVEHYERTIQTVKVARRWDKVMHSLALSLRTEQSILANTCETLLAGSVQADDLGPMLAEPFGRLWQDERIKDTVRRRLGHADTDFAMLVQSMMSALHDLEVKLQIGSDKQVRIKSVGKLEAFKFAINIAFSFSQHEETIARIGEANTKLETLLLGNLRNEPARKQMSHNKLFSLMQAVTRSIYEALRLSLSCKCATLHGINLALPSPRLASRQQDVDSLVSELDFRLAIVNEPEDVKGKHAAVIHWAWDELLLRILAPVSSPTSPPGLSSLSLEDSHISKKVKFTENSSPFQRKGSSGRGKEPRSEQSVQFGYQAPGPIHLKSVQTARTGTEMSFLPDLCEASNSRWRDPKPEAVNVYIEDRESGRPGRRFRVNYPSIPMESENLIVASLENILDQGRRPAPLSKRHLMAAVAAGSILNLHSTPWIPERLTSKDIYFAVRCGKVDYDTIFVKGLPALDSSDELDILDDVESYDGNPSLHALGVLLMEIMLWKPIHDFWDDSSTEYTNTPHQVLLNIRSEYGFKRTSSVLDRIGLSGGQAYREAVEHCIKCDMQCDLETLDDRDFREAVYARVVAPLQDAARITASTIQIGRQSVG